VAFSEKFHSQLRELGNDMHCFNAFSNGKLVTEKVTHHSMLEGNENDEFPSQFSIFIEAPD